MTLETATITDDGLEEARAWVAGETFTVGLVPAELRDRELAGIPIETQAYRAFIPRGLTLSTDKHRFTYAGSVYRVRSVVTTPGPTVALLERTQ